MSKRKGPSRSELIIRALRTGPKLTSELCPPDTGAKAFVQRIFDLRQKGYVIKSEQVSQSNWRYTLVSEPSSAVGVGSPVSAGPVPGGVAAPASTGSRQRWGEHKVCGACGHRWHGTGMGRECPACGAGLQWTEDHWTPAAADARAREVRPLRRAA